MEYSERRKLQAKETEHRILQAALELMRERGFETVSVRDICNQANITTGAFYHHFPSKEALISRGFGALDRYVEKALEGHEEDSPALRLQIILEAYADFMEQQSGELTARYYLMRLSNVQAGIRLDPTHYIKRAMVDCIQESNISLHIPALRSPEWAADFCYGHFRGCVVDWVLSGYAYSLKERMLDHYNALLSLFQFGQGIQET